MICHILNLHKNEHDVNTMMRNFRNYFIDMTLLAMGFLCILTGFVKWPGLIVALGLTSQAFLIDMITQVHDWTGLVLGIMVVLHVVMHLKWFIEMTKKVFRNKSGEHEKARVPD